MGFAVTEFPAPGVARAACGNASAARRPDTSHIERGAASRER
jgi:hypothetical protein